MAEYNTVHVVYEDGQLKLEPEIQNITIDEFTCNLQPITTRLDSDWASMVTTRADIEPREVIVKNIKAIKCPCCGAPISKSADHNCDYCGMYLSLEREEV